MPPVNIAESSDKVVEINHHLVRLDTTHSLQRHHYLSDWSNPRELFTTLLHPHGSHHRTSDSHFAESQPGLVTNSDSSDLLYLSSTSGGSHHEFNGTHHGGASGDLTGLSPSLEDTEEESLIVIYALFLPLLVTLIFILLVALYVRKMRRSSSMLEVDDRERYALEELGLPGDLAASKVSVGDVKALTTSFTMEGGTPVPPPRRSTNKKKLAYLTRSISMLGISSGSEKKVAAAPAPTAQFYGQEPRKRWNTSGFLNSTNSLSSSSDDVRSEEMSCASSSAASDDAPSSDQVSTASSSNDVEGAYADSGVTSSFTTATSSSSGASSTSGSEEVEEGSVPPVAARRKKHRKNHHHHHHDHDEHQENRSHPHHHHDHHQHHHHHHHHERRDPYVSALEEGPIPVVVEDNYYKIEAMLQAMEKDGGGLESKRSSMAGSAGSLKKSFGGKMLDIVNIPKRIKQSSAEKKRFNVYTIPMETREQLKQIYVY